MSMWNYSRGLENPFFILISLFIIQLINFTELDDVTLITFK